MNYIEILAIKYKMHPPVIRDIKDTKNSMSLKLEDDASNFWNSSL